MKSYKNLDKSQLSKFIKVINLSASANLQKVVLKNKNKILNALHDEGGVLIRNALGYEESFPEILKMIFENDFQFSTIKGDNTPRNAVYQNVLYASEIPKEFYLHQHFEDTFLKIYPKFIAFYCFRPPPKGEGATPLAKVKDILNSIPEEIVEKIPHSTLRFTRYIPSKKNEEIKEINKAYKQIFNTKSDMVATLDRVFHTENKKEIENFITLFFGFNIENPKDYIKWDLEGNLEFSVDAEKMHPPLGNIIRAAQEVAEQQDDDSWCTTLINKCSFDVQDEFEKAMSLSGSFTSNLNNNDLSTILKSLISNTCRFQWKQGDLLILNNEKITHGREPFSIDDRRIFVTKWTTKKSL